ncbi:MAG: hypothetical protein HYV47_03355 [Candidatus Nealsonbacteria bacterium]|nr:hypothetical protein [Candidatus Nealsonbacteria bacterium]
MIKKPYVGITGFMRRQEVSAVLEQANLRVRMLMVGVLVSSKTLSGRQNKWPNRYPKIKEMADIFPEDPNALNLIHYNTDEPETLANQLLELTDRGGHNLRGFQLNIAWPFPIELFAYRFFLPR